VTRPGHTAGVDDEFPTGEWHVERVGGLLPPLGVSKRIGDRHGVTYLFGVPVARFSRAGHSLIYDRLPIRDRLTRLPDGSWLGSGMLLGWEFCRFRLRPR
jgi:hypothetical protein